MDGKELQESEGGPNVEVLKCVKQFNGSNCANGVEIILTESQNMDLGEAELNTLQDQFSKLSCEESVPAMCDTSQPENVSNLET